MIRDGHTPSDHAALTAAGVDPADVQPRDRRVPCWECGTPTLNITATCTRHYLPPTRARREVTA